MLTVPVGFQACLQGIFDAIRQVDGWLTDCEVECLALLAACPTATGEILEIGSFRGKSTIVLTRAAALTNQPHVVAVDPFVLEGPKLVDSNGGASARALFEANLRKAGVEHQVELHEAYSYEVGTTWDRPIRLLWVDGDHTYEGASTDLEMFLPFLADGAIVAFHDILHPFQCVRAFREGVVESPHFGPMGICGSIGWAQYSAEVSPTTARSVERRKLARRLRPLEQFGDKKLCGISKIHYKIRRWIARDCWNPLQLMEADGGFSVKHAHQLPIRTGVGATSLSSDTLAPRATGAPQSSPLDRYRVARHRLALARGAEAH